MYGTSIYNSLLMAGTMTDSVKSDSGKKDPPYPGESPTGPEFDAWNKAFGNLLKGTDFPAGIQGKVPPSLIGISEEIPMNDMQEQVPGNAETASEARARATFNLKIRQSKREEEARAKSYVAGIQKLKNALAGRIISMLTEGKAPGLLAKLKAKHLIGPKENDVHDGFEMYKELIQGRTTKDGPTAKREGQWYERKYHNILRDQLYDHCSVQDYASKVVMLREELLPNFRTISLEKERLSEIIVQLMPHCNQAEGRVLEREMAKEGKFDDPDAVLAACTAIVSGNSDSTIEDARREAGSMPEGAPRVAAIAAAAAMRPGVASPGISTYPPRHNPGGG